MISVSEARKLIFENCNSSAIREISISEATGLILAEPVYSISDTPPFNQSAMDGYAFSYNSWDKKSGLIITGEFQAGSYTKEIIGPMNAVRIFTGAALPEGTDTVVMHEKISVSGNSIFINDDLITQGNNVRIRGTQSKTGSLLLQKGTYMHPSAIAYLSSEGISTIEVFSKPKISLIITGNELIHPGNKLPPGKIYESNSNALIAGLNQLRITPESVSFTGDDENDIAKAIEAQKNSDIIIITGGVSAGNYDFVPSCFEKCGFNNIFHKVKQKPGKPILFGKCDNTIAFGLPGNPAAVLTCFYEYIVPAITSFTKVEYFKKIQLPLANEYFKKKGLTNFLKGKIISSKVTILENQESYLLNSFAAADCIVELGEEKDFFTRDEIVSVNLIY